MARQQHLSLKQLLEHYKDHWQEDILFKDSNGFNLIVYSFSALMSEQDLGQLCFSQIKLINLSSIAKKSNFVS